MASNLYPARAHVLRTLDKLTKLLPATERTKPQILLLTGEATPYRNDTDREMPFRQESNFFYLSGCTIPSSSLLVAYQPGTSLSEHPSVQLFIPPVTPADVTWSVPPPSAEEASKSHDASKVANAASLPDALDTLLKALPGALLHTLPYSSPLFPETPKELTAQVMSNQNGVAITDLYLLPALQIARLIKDSYEIDLIRKACNISSRAHETVMRVLGLGVKRKLEEQSKLTKLERPLLPGEWLIEKEAEAEAIFVASCRREGSQHQAYLPIVAGSTRASTLHYCCNDKDLAWGPVGSNEPNNNGDLSHTHDSKIPPQVLLIDAGCEWDNYASDITRTMPVGNGGKFTPEARQIYELVLKMQESSFHIIKPGLHWDAVQLLCHKTLIRGFQKLGIFHSPPTNPDATEEAIIASGVSAAFFPHGVGHSLGMDVHDVPSASKPKVNPTLKVLQSVMKSGMERAAAANGDANGKSDSEGKVEQKSTAPPQAETGIGEIEGGGTVGPESFYELLRLRLPLQAGMVVTVEPGIYFSSHLLSSVRSSPLINHEVLAKYEPVGGVRIEDVIEITSDGYENLTKVKKERAWVESVCSGEI